MGRDISGNVAFITGGGSPHGIGAATGRLLAQRGCRVVLADVNRDTLEETVKGMAVEGLDVTAVVADVADFESMKSAADGVFDRFGAVDIAYLNAGIAGGGGYFDADDMQSWRNVFDVNFFGVVNGVKVLVPRMMAQNTVGDVLATTSGAGTVGVMYETPAYSSSKAAVLTLFEGLYAKLRDAGSLIRAHAVFPPLTKTNLAGDPQMMPFVQQGLESSGVVAVLAEPEEVAVTVLETIESGTFWGRHDNEADQRLYAGKFAGDIDWQNRIIRARADAFVNGTDPDPYLWGRFT